MISIIKIKMNPWFNSLRIFSPAEEELFKRFSAGHLSEKNGRPTTRLMAEEREKAIKLSRRLAHLHAQLYGTAGAANVRLGLDTKVGPSSGLLPEGEVSAEEVLRRLYPWEKLRSILHSD